MATSLIKKHVGVLLMRGASLDIYVPAVLPSVVTLQLPSEVYAEMEIKDTDLAAKLLVDFFKANKIPPTIFYLIAQSPLFRKEFPLAPQEKLESTINTYLDYIPFDNVFSKRIKTDKGVMVLAANGDLIQSLKIILSSASSSIEYITPLEGLSLFSNGGLGILTSTSGDIVLNNIPLIKQEAFSLVPQRSIVGFEAIVEEEESKPKSSLPLLLSVFVILLIILVVVYLKFK
jgi:hypothetical protein